MSGGGTMHLPGDPDHIDRYTCDVCGKLQVVVVWDTGVTIDGQPVDSIEVEATQIMSQVGRIDRELVDVESRTCTSCEA